MTRLLLITVVLLLALPATLSPQTQAGNARDRATTLEFETWGPERLCLIKLEFDGLLVGRRRFDFRIGFKDVQNGVLKR